MITEHRIYNETQREWRITSQFSVIAKRDLFDPTLPEVYPMQLFLDLSEERRAIERSMSEG